jgi:TIR domain/CHAT domain
MIKILFLAANPGDTDRLRLDEEVRAIRERLRMATHGGQFAVEQEWAVRVGDLQSHLLCHQPQIVHFSGHGSRAGEIVLEDQAGHSQAVPPAALKQLFATLKDDIRCVVLNACFSEMQAGAIAESIDCVVGMSAAIADESAVSFASSFYQALGFGRDVRTAFELGCEQIGLESLAGEETPKLITAPGVDARTIFLVRNSPRPAQATPKHAQDTAAMSQVPGAVEVFFSYAHKDERLRNQLEDHLSNLKRQDVITGWHDRKIAAGTEWKGQIDSRLESARIILLLVSANFLASDYCYDIELKRALERHEAGEARVIPIILRPCDWHTAPFGKLQALPTDTKPVTEWSSRDRAFHDISTGIRKVVEELAQNP